MTNKEVTKMFKDVFNNPVGEKCLTHLKKTLVDRPIYKKGLSFDEVAFREGQADVVKQILSEVNSNV